MPAEGSQWTSSAAAAAKTKTKTKTANIQQRHIHSFIHSLTTKLIAVIGGVGAAAAPVAAADRIARSDVFPSPPSLAKVSRKKVCQHQKRVSKNGGDRSELIRRKTLIRTLKRGAPTTTFF